MRAWFVVIPLGLALGAGMACGDGDSSAEEACAKLCGCEPESTPACVGNCKEAADREGVGEACFSCILGSTCDDYFEECNEVCNFDGPDGEKQRFLP